MRKPFLALAVGVMLLLLTGGIARLARNPTTPDPGPRTERTEAATTSASRAAPAATPSGRGPGDDQPEDVRSDVVRPPAAGRYVYAVLSDPADESLDVPLELVQDIETRTEEGSVQVTYRFGPPGAETIEVARWEPDRVVRLSTTTPTTDGRRTTCTYDPPLVLLQFPLAAATTSHRSWSSPTCDGTLDIRISGQERVPDARGRLWDTWIVEHRSPAPGTMRAAAWVSPELGVEVRGERTWEDWSGPERRVAKQVTALLRHPGRS